ncbi:MAG: ammonium transporter [Spirochaetota bacterium]|nr:ammonium transporter [Spirochaetota bacterium]
MQKLSKSFVQNVLIIFFILFAFSTLIYSNENKENKKIDIPSKMSIKQFDKTLRWISSKDDKDIIISNFVKNEKENIYKLKKDLPEEVKLKLFNIIDTSNKKISDINSVSNSSNTGWLLISSALVLLMIPGLAFFYGGMVRTKNILNTLMLSFISLGVITIQWVIIGYSLSFGSDAGSIIGKLDYFFLKGVSHVTLQDPKDIPIPQLLFMAFQGMFAIITPALISGAIAERIKFSAYVIFILLWSTIVYDPICHWIWGGGWLYSIGETLGWGDLHTLDFAGGIVIHLSSGVSALAIILTLGKRKGYPSVAILPNNLNFTILGAGLLWFGWFGFNAGSAYASGSSAILAFTNTFVAAAAGAVSWGLVEKWHRGKASALGIVSGIIAGLATITPAAGFVVPQWALLIGFLAGFICYGGVMLKARLGYDDSLDVFGIHGVGGIFGSLSVGIFATEGANGLITGSGKQFVIQLIAILVIAIYSFILTWVIVKILNKIMGIRVSAEDEIRGLDQTQHGETGYNI